MCTPPIPKFDAWALARECGVTEIVTDVTELAPLNLDVIVDFAGFGTTTAGAIFGGTARRAHHPGGAGAQRGDDLHCPELVLKAVTSSRRPWRACT